MRDAEVVTSLALSPSLECMVQSQLTATSTSQVPSDSPASASQVAGITGTHRHTQLIFVFLVEMCKSRQNLRGGKHSGKSYRSKLPASLKWFALTVPQYKHNQLDRVSLCCPDGSAVAQSQLTTTLTSQAEGLTMLPRLVSNSWSQGIHSTGTFKVLGLQVSATEPGLKVLSKTQMLESNGAISAHCNLRLRGSIQMEFCHVGQAGLQLLTSGDLPALASQSAGITGVSQHSWPQRFRVCLGAKMRKLRLRELKAWPKVTR
ncbi:Protein GVQW1 [Plecturocebus cupreus]